MSVRVEVVGEQRLAEALDALLPAEPHLDYANFAPVAHRGGAAEGLHRLRWLETKGRIFTLVATSDDGRPLALLRAETRPWESDHFDLAMAKLEMPVAHADDETRFAALAALYPEALRRLAADAYAHVAIRTSTRDRAAGWAAQDAGARHVDTQVSWMCALTGTPHDDALPEGLVFEEHDRASVRTIAEADWERLAHWGAAAFDRGPLVFDRTLPRDRAQDVYRVWTERVMRGEWADAILVVRRGGEVVAFISMLEMPDVSAAAGRKVCGRGLGATLPEYRGLFTAIQREMIARRPLDASFMENETQVATIGSINVYARLGFRYLRSTSTWHARLDAGATSCA